MVVHQTPAVSADMIGLRGESAKKEQQLLCSNVQYTDIRSLDPLVNDQGPSLRQEEEAGDGEGTVETMQKAN